MRTWLTKADSWIQAQLAQYEKQPACSRNILCEKRNWHACEYRTVSVNTFWRRMKTL